MSDTVPSSEDLLAAWREAETQQERDEILADMEVDEIEAGWMATNGMPFAGEVSGGGRGASLNVPSSRRTKSSWQSTTALQSNSKT